MTDITTKIQFNDQGLVPVIAQDALDGTVLMLAWANREALEETAQTGFGTYFSRSRQQLWRKGEQSGCRQRVREILLDCDGDAVIYKVEQKGVACHTGHRSCFYRSWHAGQWVENSPVVTSPEDLYGQHKERTERFAVISEIADVIDSRKGADPSTSYVAKLLAKAPDGALKKVGEEATEVVMAAKDNDAEHLIYETADLWFHTMVVLAQAGLRPEQVIEELRRREGLSGLAEKAARKG